ncbi:eukaryotic translation initiation factor 4 gamma 1-like isoform X2 [Dunckerocampus dactyliophorus]|uniref:eukaryotic translation initiation factor 4 gamma 1-like isoform X2 n=1 Tax=Dunckerocampus dactyliophorus TaxID=161453 RepID=UPI0024056CEA|nr:eukaryotic translation initiation factor 4 gamma 1-like isoform X2 [Dunckerocampus dactyliophorus]
MNKAPQPGTGPPSTPHPAPSPGLSQSSFPPGQPPSIVFATPPAPQMNPTPQPRQGNFRSLQPYYTNRASLPPSSGPRGVPPNSAPRPVTPTHVYQPGPGSQMMMIPGQQLPFPSSPQGAAYFIPGQYRSPTYVATPQQYPVPAGTPGFYPGTSPAEYSSYAGAYYPAQPQFTPPVQAAPVIMNPAPQQQQPPPQPPQHIHTKRERKQITIRDPNQGGRDITEEIMSGGRSGSTPTPPQTAISGSDSTGVSAANAECVPAAIVPAPLRADDTENPLLPHLSQPPDTIKNDPHPTEATSSDMNIRPNASPLISEATGTSRNSLSTPVPSVPIVDVMDTPKLSRELTPEPQTAPEVPAYPAPIPDPVPTSSGQENLERTVTRLEEEVVKEEEIQPEDVSSSSSFMDKSYTPSVTSNGMAVDEPERPLATLPSSCLEAPLESPIAQPEELRLPNGLPLPVPQDPEAPATSTDERDASPIAEPDVCLQPDLKISEAITKAVPTSVVKTATALVDESASGVTPVPAEAITQAGPSQPESHETVHPVSLDTKKDTPMPESNAKGESSPGPVDDQTPETVISPPQIVPPALVETAMQAAVSVPKKKRKMKDLNKKEAVGDLLDAFKEEKVVVPPEPEIVTAPSAETQLPAPPPALEDADLTWEDKEDKLDAENIQPDEPEQTAASKKYQYKEEQWQPINPEEKKKYDREFLLGFQFTLASMNKPEGLPAISDVVLDKANKTPLRQLDPSRLPGMNCGPDFTPSFANLGRPGMGVGSRGPPPGMGMGMGGPRRSQQMQRKEPRKIITSMSLSDDVKLNKAEKAWKPSVKKAICSRTADETEDTDPDQLKTQELFKSVRSILNKLTPQKFQQLMKQVTELKIDTEERLKGVIDLTFEKAISEPDFSVAYASMCRCVMGLKVQATDKPGDTVNFRKLLLNRCQKEFEKDKDDNEIFEKKQKELEAATEDEKKQRLTEELEEAKYKARKRSLGNIKFIGELFKFKMLTEVIMHDCIVKLLKNHDEESLECLCRLLSTIGKDLDFEKAKPRMDQYFNQMEKIIKERKTTSRIRFMLQDVVDLRENNWVPRRGDQGPKTIDQIHKEAELEEHREQMKVHQALISKKESVGGPGSRMGGPGSGSRGGPHTPSRGVSPQDDSWSTVTICKNRPYDGSRLSKITKTSPFDAHNQCLAPGGKGTLSWGRGSSGGSSTKPTDSGPESGGRPATSTLNRYSALQQSASGPSLESDRRVPQRNSSSRERGEQFDRSDHGLERRDDRDRHRIQVAATRSFSRENERSRERDQRGTADPVRRVANRTDDRDQGRENVRRETTSTPPPPQTPTKPLLTVEELTKKSKAIIEEYLHNIDIKEPLQCVQEINCPHLLSVFVQCGLELTLERSNLARENMGRLLQQLIKAGILPVQQFYKGLHEILEIADEMAIDIPHIWLYLSELIAPMLHEGGIPMGYLFKEISKPLTSLGKAGDLLALILNLLCKGMSHKKVGTMWREAELQWKDFLPEDVDVNKFVTEKNVAFTLSEEPEKSKKKEMSSAELTNHLDRLIQDKADNQRMLDWIEANLDEQQTASHMFIRALMTCICQSAIICENPYKVNDEVISQRAKLLQKFLNDEQKELQALYALQALMVHMEQPANLLRMFFDTLYDEEVIRDEAFYKWESSKDPAEQQGKGVALKSVKGFFTWLHQEDESDNV